MSSEAKQTVLAKTKKKKKIRNLVPFDHVDVVSVTSLSMNL